MSELKPPNPNGIKLPAPLNTPVDLEPVAREMSQEDIDRETSKVRLEAEKIKLRKELLELEKLTSDIETIRTQRAKSTMSAESVQDALSHSIEERKNHEEGCTHMKGGASEDLLHGAISRGTDSTNYAFITHVLPWGIRFRMCQRCGRTWFPGDIDYKWAMSRPSKNSASGSCAISGLIRNVKQKIASGEIRTKSEIPHTNVPEADVFSQGPAGF